MNGLSKQDAKQAFLQMASLQAASYASSAEKVSHVKRLVAERFGITLADLDRSTRAHEIVWPRQIAVWLVMETHHLPTAAVAREFKIERSLVTYACKTVNRIISAYPRECAIVTKLKEELQNEQ